MGKRTAIIILLMGFALLQGKAQQGRRRIRGAVLDERQHGVEGATVKLMLLQDSAAINTTITDKDGEYVFFDIPNGTYGIRITAIGFAPVSLGSISVGNATAGETDIKVGKVNLQKTASTLQGVTVNGRRPLVEQHPDKTIINVDASVTSMGSTALEVLQRSPGVTVDKDGNISLKGKSGVLVMLDGKPSYLSGADLAGLLSSMNANQLEQIEIMTNPPASMDASGNAGVINIRTKKNRSKGFNGSVSLGYGQGVYWKTSNSLNLNYRDASKNLFLNYTSNASAGFTDLHIVRSYLAADNHTITARYDQPSYLVRTVTYNNLKLGIDYYLSKQTTLGAQVSGFINPRHVEGDGNGYLLNANGVTDSIIYSTSRLQTKVNNGAVNLNLRHAFDSVRNLSVDADFITYNQKNPQYYVNTTKLPNGTLLDSSQLRGELPSTISIWSGKADYSQPLAGGRLEAGWKSSYVNTDNTADYFDLLSGDWEPDYNKTNHFLYKENINALYGSWNKAVGKWTWQAGLRFENTNYQGHQLGNPMRTDSSFSQHYNNLFPTASVSYKRNEHHQFSVNGGRRIDRPAYQDLNPFLFFINPLTYQTGNPFLKPQYTTNISISHTYRDFLTTSVYYSRTNPYFAQLFRTSVDTTIFGNYNVGLLDNWGLSEDVQFSPASYWNVTLHADVVYKKVKGYFSQSVLKSDAVVALFNASTQLRFGKGWAGEASGFFNTRDLQDQFNVRPQGQLSLGLSKQVLDGRGSIKANMQDLFFTNITNGLISYQNVREHFIQKNDTRVVNISFTLRFGKVQKGQAQRSNGGAADEQSRVKF